MNFIQVRTLDPKAVNDENCTGNTSDGGNNSWYILLATTTFCFQYLSLSLSLHARKYLI